MKLSTSYSGRVQPTEFGRLLEPATCVLCNRIGRTNDEIFANLGVELEYYGCVYLCQECCAEVARFVGYIAPEENESLKFLIEQYLKNLKYYENRVKYLERILSARIDSASFGEPVGNGDYGVPVSEAKSDPDYIDSVINGYEPVITESS